MNEWVNEWMNEWINELMNEWMNEYMNDEWMNEEWRVFLKKYMETWNINQKIYYKRMIFRTWILYKGCSKNPVLTEIISQRYEPKKNIHLTTP